MKKRRIKRRFLSERNSHGKSFLTYVHERRTKKRRLLLIQIDLLRMIDQAGLLIMIDQIGLLIMIN